MSRQLTLQQSITAGSLSGLVSGFTLQPFEVLRTKSIGLKGNASALAIARTVTATQGVKGLWRGTTASLWRQVPGIAIFYTIIESSPSKTRAERLKTGFIARTTATTLLLPLVVIKTKIEFGISTGMADATREIYRQNGVKGFWKGLLPTLARDGPYAALFFVFYREIQTAVGVDRNNDFIQRNGLFAWQVTNFTCALTAGAAATILTQPADVLRCHLQIDHRTGFDNFRAHLAERGALRALYLDGLAPRITRRSLVSAINWSVFEAARNYYHSQK